MATTPHGSRRHRRSSVWLIALGALVAISGIAWAITAKVAADDSSLGSTVMHTLPVHAYTQYTQVAHADYTGLWIGVSIAIIGLVLAFLGLVSARQRLATA